MHRNIYLKELPWKALIKLKELFELPSNSATIEKLIIDASKLQRLPGVKVGDDGKLVLVKKKSTRKQKVEK